MLTKSRGCADKSGPPHKCLNSAIKGRAQSWLVLYYALEGPRAKERGFVVYNFLFRNPTVVSRHAWDRWWAALKSETSVETFETSEDLWPCHSKRITSLCMRHIGEACERDAARRPLFIGSQRCEEGQRGKWQRHMLFWLLEKKQGAI